jgi:precorrin-6B methylase 2
MKRGLDRHTLYELCVQSPRHAAMLLRAIHAGSPSVLREDFAGTGAVSREWIRQIRGGRAIAIDHDKATLARIGRSTRICPIVGDVMKAPLVARADAIFVGNFSIGEIHTRGALVAYLKKCASRLARGGIFVCDTYAGQSAFKVGSVRRQHHAPGGVRVTYTWEQREADPLTAMVVNAIHFRADRAGDVVADIADAFVYHWRLWSVPELRDAMLEAGLGDAAVYNQLPDAVDSEGNAYVEPVEDPEELGESFIVCVAARRA